MALQQIGDAIRRVKSALQRRPDMALHEDVPALAQWTAGTRVQIAHTNGTRLATDMPVELGGSGDQVTPGWLFRAGLASCATTSIVLAAAEEGVALTRLSVQACSHSDARGLLGMAGADGAPVHAGPLQVALHVTIAAEGADADALHSLVARCLGHSPVPSGLQAATPYQLRVHPEPA